MSDRVKAILANNRFEIVIRFILGGIFIAASVNKIIEPAHFAKIIYGYYLFPEYSINLIAIVLPYIELFSGTALVLGTYPRSASLILGTLLFLFSVAITINLARGVEFDCGCFSFDEPGYFFSAKQLLFRDILFLISSIYICLYSENRKWCLRQTGSLLSDS